MNWILPLHATKISSDFRRPGDSSCAIWQDDAAQGAVLVVRPDQVGWDLDLGLGTWYLNHYLIILVDSGKMVVCIFVHPFVFLIVNSCQEGV